MNETDESTLVNILWETTAHMRGMRQELLALKTHLEESPQDTLPDNQIQQDTVMEF